MTNGYARNGLKLAVLLFAACVATASWGQAQQAFDTVIINGTVIDGTGGPSRKADVGIRGGIITAIGDLKQAKAGHTIDATGLVVTPGFIDVHAHADDSAGDWRGVRSPDPQVRAATPNVTQGITT